VTGQRVGVSLFSGAWDRDPKPAFWTVAELVEKLSDYRVVHHSVKESVDAWSPAAYRSGTTRRKENVLFVSCLVLDVDSGASIDSVWNTFPDHQRILYTTWSHNKSMPKCRLVLPLQEPVPGSHWFQSWVWANTRATRRGIAQDPSCKDSSRLYFLPAVPGPKEYNDREVRYDIALPRIAIPWQTLPDPAEVLRAANKKRALRGAHARMLAGRDQKTDYTDPDVRERVAAAVEARVVGDGIDRRATRGLCPACGRYSVFWYILSRFAPATCDHRNTCGWRGPLAQLERR
jgi:hypothetical protein